ncbi:MAG: FlgD immunoglobulin-like domain containing protein [Candidatus Eisenbacteria bacterium]
MAGFLARLMLGIALVAILPRPVSGVPSIVVLEKTRGGCLLCDDFNDGVMDTSSNLPAGTKWNPMYADSNLYFREVNGYFQVLGQTGPEFKGQHKGIQTNPFAYQGWSIASLETLELVSIVDMRNLDPISPAYDTLGSLTESRMAHHYCSNCNASAGDFNATITIGFLLGTATGPGWDPPGGKWGYRAKWHEYADRYLDALDTLWGNEPDVFFATMVDNYGFDAADSTLTTGYVRHDGQWVVVGSRKLFMSTCRKTELKSMSGWARNRNIDYRWDNYRLFPNSKRYPVVFDLVDVNLHPILENYSLSIHRTDTGALVDKDTLDIDSRFRLYLDHTEMVIPAGLELVLLQELVDTVGVMFLPASGVSGCYPNDAYRIILDTSTVPTEVGAGDPPARARLFPNAPNPWNPMTRIEYELPSGPDTVPVRLRIYEPSGRLVRALVDGEIGGGRHEAVWDGTDRNGESVPSGVYLYRLEVEGADPLTRRMVLLR